MLILLLSVAHAEDPWTCPTTITTPEEAKTAYSDITSPIAVFDDAFTIGWDLGDPDCITDCEDEEGFPCQQADCITDEGHHFTYSYLEVWEGDTMNVSRSLTLEPASRNTDLERPHLDRVLR